MIPAINPSAVCTDHPSGMAERIVLDTGIPNGPVECTITCHAPLPISEADSVTVEAEIDSANILTLL